MGIEIDRTEFDEQDAVAFRARLEGQLEQLDGLLRRPGFGVGPESIGAELELYIVDLNGRPMFRNQELHDAAADPQLTLELNQYNLEYNLSPRLVAQQGLRATEQEICEKLAGLASIARDRDLRIIPIGILPTLQVEDFGQHCITQRKRYRALVSQLIKRRGSRFHIDINGVDPLQMEVADITLEGANTSFQVHLRVAPEDYAATFNAVQLVTPLALAISANSPGLFGHQLWEETRVPLFKQSIDTRASDRYGWVEPPRVCFGHGWVRKGALELFEQAVRLYPPLLPACAPEVDQRRAGAAPELAELRLHQSTVWLWNRPVYDDANGGHLRIELRSLPAGPSAIDMVAGAALMLGLARGLREEMDHLLPALPFPLAEYNFYRAAQHGLDARLVWPQAQQSGLREQALTDILASLLPVADAGLRSLGVAQSERDRYLNIIDARLTKRCNGARWQRQCAQGLMSRGADKHQALAGMLDRYSELSAANQPVAEWPI